MALSSIKPLNGNHGPTNNPSAVRLMSLYLRMELCFFSTSLAQSWWVIAQSWGVWSLIACKIRAFYLACMLPQAHLASYTKLMHLLFRIKTFFQYKLMWGFQVILDHISCNTNTLSFSMSHNNHQDEQRLITFWFKLSQCLTCTKGVVHLAWRMGQYGKAFSASLAVSKNLDLDWLLNPQKHKAQMRLMETVCYLSLSSLQSHWKREGMRE